MRNCRFLQGPSTDKDAVARIRVACEEGKPRTEVILNYRADGSPFCESTRVEQAM